MTQKFFRTNILFIMVVLINFWKTNGYVLEGKYDVILNNVINFYLINIHYFIYLIEQ